MSREVRHDGDGTLEVRFPFDRALVDRIKTLPRRRWNAAERCWGVPEGDLLLLIDLLEGARFQFDAPTTELCRAAGRTMAPGTAPVEPGLFDAPSSTGSSARIADATTDLSVSELNESVRRVLADAFPHSLWVVGEISGFARNAHKRHVTFRLVELDAAGTNLSSVDATLFADARSEIEAKLARAGDPFRLGDEIRVRVRARVELYVPWGSYRILVEDLDPTFTLGEAARRREEILRRLGAAGLLGRNDRLSLAHLPLRVGLITSVGSDAANDVLRTLEESGYAFDVTVHGARVQGRTTEPSVLNALDWFESRAQAFDVVLICRGGGSRTDLAWFDSEALGRAVATFPLPVVIGIGHEQDRSVLDAVARSAKTPTAAAAFVVAVVDESLARVEECRARLLAAASASIENEARLARECGRRLALAVRARLERERVQISWVGRRLAGSVRASVQHARSRMDRSAVALPRAVAVRLARQRERLRGAARGIAHAARRDVAVGRHRLAANVVALGPRAARRMAAVIERNEARERRLTLVDPRRVIERGYALLRSADGRVVTSPTAAPSGSAVRAELRDGRLRLRSEGVDAE